jgi:hypothetical protein
MCRKLNDFVFKRHFHFGNPRQYSDRGRHWNLVARVRQCISDILRSIRGIDLTFLFKQGVTLRQSSSFKGEACMTTKNWLNCSGLCTNRI